MSHLDRARTFLNIRAVTKGSYGAKVCLGANRTSTRYKNRLMYFLLVKNLTPALAITTLTRFGPAGRKRTKIPTGGGTNIFYDQKEIHYQT
jgi:hypothetical protein